MGRKIIAYVGVAVAVLAAAAPAGAWTWPVDGAVLRTFSFGSDPYAAGHHRGIDVAGNAGAPVRAPAAGVVSFAGTVPGGGKTITIRTADGYAVTLLHLGALSAERGSAVREGEPVGIVGASGDVEHAEPYVHLGIRAAAEPEGYLDPMTFIDPQNVPPAPVEEPADGAGAGTDAPADEGPSDEEASEAEPSAGPTEERAAGGTSASTAAGASVLSGTSRAGGAAGDHGRARTAKAKQQSLRVARSELGARANLTSTRTQGAAKAGGVPVPPERRVPPGRPSAADGADAEATSAQREDAPGATTTSDVVRRVIAAALVALLPLGGFVATRRWRASAETRRRSRQASRAADAMAAPEPTPVAVPEPSSCGAASPERRLRRRAARMRPTSVAEARAQASHPLRGSRRARHPVRADAAAYPHASAIGRRASGTSSSRGSGRAGCTLPERIRSPQSPRPGVYLPWSRRP